MKQRIFLLLFTGLILAAGSTFAQTDSASMAKRQKEIEKSEKSISNAQAKVNKKDRKMERLQKRADRKARKKDKKMEKLRKAERKHEKLISDTSLHSYLGPVKGRNIALLERAFQDNRFTFVSEPDMAERLRNSVRA